MGELVPYDVACRALSEARSVSEIKNIRDKSDAMRFYARQAKNKQLEVDAAEIRIRAERRLGEMLIEQKETVGMNTGMAGSIVSPTGREALKDDRPTLADVGIDYKLSSRAQKIAAVDADDFEDTADRWREYSMGENHAVSLKAFYDLADGKEKTPHVAQSTGEFEWYSPIEIIEAARRVCGDFDLDPASCDMAQENVRAKAYFTENDNGLDLDWYGRIWMNPPYAVRVVDQFTDKLCAHITAGDVTEAFVLVNNATETGWFQRMMQVCQAISFPRGRLKFSNPGGKVSTPLQGQVVVYFGSNYIEFGKEFQQFGSVLFAERGNL